MAGILGSSKGGAGGLGQALVSASKGLSTGINSRISQVVKYKNMGSAAANAASAASQANQFAYNSAEAVEQRNYNEAMWDKNAAYNSAEAAIARDFNAAEAQKNRDWQEKMSNTSYQRAVADLKKARLNPVIAALHGGANVGSGAMASGSAASSSPASSGMASGSNYTGQGSNISENLAIFGAIGNMIAQGMSALGVWLGEKQDDIDAQLKDYHLLYADNNKADLFNQKGSRTYNEKYGSSGGNKKNSSTIRDPRVNYR